MCMNIMYVYVYQMNVSICTCMHICVCKCRHLIACLDAFEYLKIKKKQNKTSVAFVWLLSSQFGAIRFFSVRCDFSEELFNWH